MAKSSKIDLAFGGESLTLTKSKDMAAVRFNPGASRRGVKKSAAGETSELESFSIIKGRGIDAKLDQLRKDAGVAAGTHVYHIGENEIPFVPTGKIYIEFGVDADSSAKADLLEKLHLRVIENEGENICRAAVTALSPNPIKVCAALQKSKIVRVAEPELATFPQKNDFAPPVGPYIKTQWHHRNTGDAIPIVDIDNAVFGPQHFKKGADARVAETWKELQSTGSAKIRIAVIDTGFDIEHPAFMGKIRFPYNAADDTTDVTPIYWTQSGEAAVASHGTSCAAVAAGDWTALGIFGAAPEAQIIPIKLNILSDSAVIRAFRHALNNGADIISCSLGWPTPVPLSTDVSNFLKKVAREGRGGKGVPMFFAAGNANPASNNVPRRVSDFAAHPEGICVTASNSLDELSDYSFFGPNAWITAPTNGNEGVGITTAHVGWDGVSLQRESTSGFGGTSSAAPLAAGCCALMLSAEPNLTVIQIKEILKRTAEKIPVSGGYDSNGHSDQTGFGRINALLAVKMAKPGANTGSTTGTSTGTTPAPTPKPLPPATHLKGKVKSKFLNVRSGPGTNFSKVQELKTGQIVELLEKVDAWFRIGEGKWVKSDFLEIVQPPRQGKVISADTLNVRSGPDVSFSKVTTIKPGAAVEIFETSANGWHRIGQDRWVSGRFIQIL